MAGIEALPEAALFAAIAAKPVLRGGSGAAGFWFGGRRSGVECAANHGVGKWKKENGSWTVEADSRRSMAENRNLKDELGSEFIFLPFTVGVLACWSETRAFGGGRGFGQRFHAVAIDLAIVFDAAGDTQSASFKDEPAVAFIGFREKDGFVDAALIFESDEHHVAVVFGTDMTVSDDPTAKGDALAAKCGEFVAPGLDD